MTVDTITQTTTTTITTATTATISTIRLEDKEEVEKKEQQQQQQEKDVFKIIFEYLTCNYRLFNQDPPPPPLLGGKYDGSGELEYPNIVDDVQRTEKDMLKNVYSFMAKKNNYPTLSPSSSSSLLLECEKVLDEDKELCRLVEIKEKWSWHDLALVSKHWLGLVSSLYMFMGVQWFNTTYLEHLSSPYSIFKRASRIIFNRSDPDAYNHPNFNKDNKLLVDYINSATSITLYGKKYRDIDKMFYEGVIFPEVEELIIHLTPDVKEMLESLLPRLPKLKVLCCSDFDIISGEFTIFDSDEQLLYPLINFIANLPKLESLGLYIDGLSSEHFFIPFFQAFKTDERLFNSGIKRLVVDVNPNIQTDFPWMLLLNLPSLQSFSLYDLHMVDYSVEFHEFMDENRTITDLDFIIICDEETCDILGDCWFMSKLDLFIAEYQDEVKEIFLPSELKTLIIRIGNDSLASLTNCMIQGINQSVKCLQSLSFLIDGPIDPNILAHEIQHNATIKYLSFTCLRSKKKLIKSRKQQEKTNNNQEEEETQTTPLQQEEDLYDPKISFASLFQAIKHYNTTLEVISISFCPTVLPDMIDCIIDHPCLKMINFEHFDNTLEPHQIDCLNPHFIPNLDHLASSSISSQLIIIPTPRGVQIIKKNYLDKIKYQLLN
ncbi:hypothetical protein DFA_07844 [Cavenderia fasciculata]|uniref:Uncharacterized protein n=1 Tax=Cavenderia fasciculata TaxID=261658 RepID=F4Q3P8_CACFS|nr:uncharacterized protein DFA_07844 [Cavenderia fasciculata]EGG16864.1 hypothetical protein DFA_07844 [Cavenderia fasciculata]|eukprot:XP_004355338.1 hypothetical protein DFA_07844 [Cavenderia fasciculata]